MSQSRFPTMLNKRATMLSRFTRRDLVIVGVIYLVLSYLKVSGIALVVIVALSLLLLKFSERKFQRGFFRHLNGEKKLNWGYKL